MATIVVNPTASSNGSGSLIDPKNTYAGLSVSSGDTVLQVAETTFAGKVDISVIAASRNVRRVA